MWSLTYLLWVQASIALAADDAPPVDDMLSVCAEELSSGTFRACLRYEAAGGWTGLSAARVEPGDTLEVLVESPLWLRPEVTARYHKETKPAILDEVSSHLILAGPESTATRDRAAAVFPAVGGDEVGVTVRWSLAAIPLTAGDYAWLESLDEPNAKELLALTVPHAEPIAPIPDLNTVEALRELRSICENVDSVEQARCGPKLMEHIDAWSQQIGREMRSTDLVLPVNSPDWYGAIRLGVAVPMCPQLTGDRCTDGLGLVYDTRPDASGADVLVARSEGAFRPGLVLSYTHAIVQSRQRRLHLGVSGGLGLIDGQSFNDASLGLRMVHLGLDVGTLNLSAAPSLVLYRRQTLPPGFALDDVVSDPARFEADEEWALAFGVVLHVPLELYRFGSGNEDSTGIRRVLGGDFSN